MALEELMCHVFDNPLEKGVVTGMVTKIVDNLYCGWNSEQAESLASCS